MVQTKIKLRKPPFDSFEVLALHEGVQLGGKYARRRWGKTCSMSNGASRFSTSPPETIVGRCSGVQKMASCTFALIPSLIFGDHLQCGNRSQSLTKKYLDSKSKKGFHSILIFIWYGRFFFLMLLQNMLTPVDDVEVLVLVDNKTDSLSRSQESSKLQPAQIHLPMDHLRLMTPFFRWAP